MTYSISFYNESSDESLEICLCDYRLYGNIDGEDLSNDELISVIDSLNESDTVKLIKAWGARRFKHAYRKLYYENPVKALDRELRENNSSLVEYLELSYKAGLNPLPALRARGIKVKFGGENTISPHFTDEDIIVCLQDGFVKVLFNPWNRETETNIVNRGLRFKIDMRVDVKRKYYSPIRKRENKRIRKILKRVKKD